MWHQINLNKQRTIFVLILMCIFLSIFGFAVGYCVMSDIVGGTAGVVIIWAIFLIILIKNTKNDYIVGELAYKLTPYADKKILNIVSEMSIAAGLQKMPEVYILDIDEPNAFAVGKNPQNSSVYLTRGLIQILNRDELQGVVAHEISHIVNRDTMYLLYAGVMVIVISLVARAFCRSFSSSSSRNSSSSKSSPVIVLVALIFIILAPIVSTMFYFLVSRKREYLADACAAQYTRYPKGLADALKKISGCIKYTNDKSEILSFMCEAFGADNDDEEDAIFGDLEKTKKYKKKKQNRNSDTSALLDTSFLNASCIVPINQKKEKDNWFSTHPATKNRIKILLSMTNADYASYDMAYSAANAGRSIVNADDLKNCKKNISIRQATPESSNIVLGAAIAASAAVNDEKMPVIDVKSPVGALNNSIDKKIYADDLIKKLADYVFVKCSCATKLKVPACYIGTEIECPHCKQKHLIEKK